MGFRSSLYFMLAILYTGCSARIQLVNHNSEGSGDEPTAPSFHDTPFCADISSWSDVEWIGNTIEKCNTTFVKERQDRKKEICDNVTEIVCDIVPYTECKLEWINIDYKEYEDVSVPYDPWICESGSKIVQHKKMMPKCYNDTRLNCITLWKTDENGNQVWAGNEDCEEFIWKRCELVPIDHNFTVPEVECRRDVSHKTTVMWDDSKEKNETRMTTQMTCEVFHAKDCNPKTINKCQTIEYTEWFEAPIETCTNITISMPNQTWEHKKCLFPDNGGTLIHHGYHGISSPHHGHGHHGHSSDHRSQTTKAGNLKIRKTRRHGHRDPLNQLIRSRNDNGNHTTSHRQFPTHPSLNGFELDNKVNRDDKSISTSTSEVTPVRKYPSYENDAQE